MFDRIGPGKAPSHPEFHVLSGIEARTAAAAKGLLPDGVLGHFVEMIADVFDHIAGFLEKPHPSGGVAGVMKGDLEIVIAARIQFEFVVFDPRTRFFILPMSGSVIFAIIRTPSPL